MPKKRHFRHFFGRQPTKILKIGTCKFGRNFFHRRKFHKTKFRYFFKNVRYIFSRFKPFSGHSVDITAVSGEKKFRRSLEILRLQVCSKKVLGAISRLMRPKMKLFAVKFRRILEVFAWWGLWRKFWAHFHSLCVQKWSCLLRSYRRILKFSPYEVYEESSWRIITIFASKHGGVCRDVETHFESSPLARVTKKFMGAFSRFMCPKTKLFAVNFRRILEVLCMQVLQKRFWVHYHYFFVQKRSCLLWNSDGFCKFSPCKLYKKVLGAISRLMRPKRNRLPWCSDAFWNFSACKVCRKSYGWNVTIYASKNEAVSCEVETHFGSFIRASFIKHFWAHFHVFLRPQTKLFAVKFRRILEVLRLQGLRRKFCMNFNDFRAPKRRCLLWSSHTFWNFSACKVYRKRFLLVRFFERQWNKEFL